MAEFTFNGLVYETINDNEVKLYKTEGLKRPVRNIPAEVEYGGKKFKVTVVYGRRAFKNDEVLTNVSLPETIRRINDGEITHSLPDGAFVNCAKLKDIFFPDSLEYIGRHAFHLCTAIETLYFGDNLKEIADSAFEGCSALKEIDFNDKLEIIDRTAFKNCSSLKNVSFPESLKTIGFCAFHGCKAMTEVNIPASVEKIGFTAFAESGVKVVNIYSENINIAADAFPADAQINFLDANSFPKRKRKPRGAKNTEAPKATHANEESAKPAHKEEKVKETPKVVPVDLEKLIQAVLADGVVTDKERAILIKKVKEAGGDVDEFELLLDARIYEAEQKNKPAETAAPKPEPKAEKVQVEEKPRESFFGKIAKFFKSEEPATTSEKEVKEETPATSTAAPSQPAEEIKEAPKPEPKPKAEKKQAEVDLPNESANSDSGWSREKWENWEKDVKPALKIMDEIVAAMPCIQDGTYQLNYTSKIYIGFAQNGKAKNFATFFPQGRALLVNAWGMENSEEIERIGKALPSFEHKVTSRNDKFHTFKFPVNETVTAEQLQAALTIIDMARKNYEK